MLPLTHVLFYNTIIYTFIRERKEKLVGDYFDFIMKEIYIKYDENLEKEKANIRLQRIPIWETIYQTNKIELCSNKNHFLKEY